MTEKRWQISGVAGILFVVLAVVSAAVQGRMPTYDEGGAAIAAWFADNSSRYLVGQFISGLGFLLFYVALVILRTGVFRSWLGWLGGLMALAAIAGSAAIVERNPEGIFSVTGSLGWLGLFIWVLGVSIALLRADKPSR